MSAFVGRRAELDALEAELELVRQGQTRLVVVEGPAGIGKTSLAERFVAGVGSVPVVWANGCVTDSGLEFGVLAQLKLGFERLAGAAPTGKLRPTDAPEGSTDAPNGCAVLSELVDVIRAATAQEPLIMVLDDAHLADKSSLDAIEVSLSLLATSAILTLVVSGDQRAVTTGLTKPAGPGRRRLHLTGLDADDLGKLGARLGRQSLSREACARLAQHTAGNPAHATALLTATPRDRLEDLYADLPAPRAVCMSVIRRLATLSADALDLVGAAAALIKVANRISLDGAAGLDLVSLVGGVDNPLVALEEAALAGILLNDQRLGGIAVRVCDLMTAAAIYDSLGPAKRANLHGRAAGLVGDETSSLEHSMTAAFAPEEGLAANLCALARDEEDRGERRLAIRHLIGAARLSPELPAGQDRLLEAGRLMALDSDIDALRGIAKQVSGCPADPRRSHALGAVGLAGNFRRPGDLEHLRDAWEGYSRMGDQSAASDAATRLSLAYSAREHLGGDVSRALHWARAASGDRPTPTYILALLNSPAAGTALGLVSSVVRDLAGFPSEEEVDAVCARGLVRLAFNQLAAARDDLGAAAAGYGALGHPREWGNALPGLALAARNLGEWDTALEITSRAIAMAGSADRGGGDRGGGDRGGVAAHAIAATIHTWRGEWEPARAHADAAKRGAEASGLELDWTSALCTEGRLVSAVGTPSQVLATLAPVLKLSQSSDRRHPSVTGARNMCAEALIRLGELREAQTMLVTEEGHSSQAGNLGHRIDRSRLLGTINMVLGEPERAADAFASGVNLGGCSLFPFGHARVVQAHAGLARRLGRRREAADALGSALSTFKRLNAQPFLHPCELELAACGLSPSKRHSPNRTSLTPTERWIAELVATGMTNTEVARELFVSVRTVESHLGKVFRKLGVSKRGELRGPSAKLQIKGESRAAENVMVW